MSSFLSNKFLQYRKQSATPIDTDLFCTSCGYNLRGLTFGRNCPECGDQIRRTSGLKDLLISGDWADRQRTKIGLTLAALCLIVAAFARLGLFIALLCAPGLVIICEAYLGLVALLTLCWVAGAWLLTPRRLDAHRFYSKLRLTVRSSQFLWLPANACWILAVSSAGTAVGETFQLWSIVLRGLAGVGALFLAALLMRLAEDAELEDAARRINLSIWMLPLPTVLLAIVPDQVAWIALFLIGPVLLIWCWYLLLFGRSVLAMQRHVSWSMKLAADRHNRIQRTDETRRELDQDVAARIRPVNPGPTEDLPLIAAPPQKAARPNMAWPADQTRGKSTH